MKLVPCFAALAAGVLVLSACEDKQMAENDYRDVPPSITYPDSPPPMSTTPTYPGSDATTIPPTANPDSPTNPDGAFPSALPPTNTPPTLN